MDSTINRETSQKLPQITQVDFNQFKSGDQKAFRKIFNAYYKSIYYYAIRFLKRKEAAEELVQEVFIVLFLNRATIDEASAIYPYVYTVAKRLVVSDFRKRVVESKFETYLGSSWSEEDKETEESMDSKELSILWSQAVSRLPSKQKEIYALSKFEGLSYQEIADKIGISKNTVKNHLLTASKTVKLIMKGIYILVLLARM